MAKIETHYCVVKVIGGRHYVTERYESRISAERKRDERREAGDDCHVVLATTKRKKTIYTMLEEKSEVND